MAIDNQLRDEKLQYDISGKAAKISALYLTDEEILPSKLS